MILAAVVLGGGIVVLHLLSRKLGHAGGVRGVIHGLAYGSSALLKPHLLGLALLNTVAEWILTASVVQLVLLAHGIDLPWSGTLLLTVLSTVVMVPFGTGGVAFGPGVLLLTGLFSLVSMRGPGKMSWFDGWEEGSDRFTFLIFVVGFPFLTAGLIQGALWAQEAWALYWGWDSKEVSALISWVFYIVYLHLRYVGGWRGEKSMWILLFGGISIYITFQLFGHLPASQSSLHRYTDMDSVPAEGMMGGG